MGQKWKCERLCGLNMAGVEWHGGCVCQLVSRVYFDCIFAVNSALNTPFFFAMIWRRNYFIRCAYFQSCRCFCVCWSGIVLSWRARCADLFASLVCATSTVVWSIQ